MRSAESFLPFRMPHSTIRIRFVMIRIIAGEFKGRRLKTPATLKVRPTADRVREAWFSIVQRSLRGARVLDLYAGTGALGLEALSRGAATADFVDVHRQSLATLRANIKLLDVAERTVIHKQDALKYAQQLHPGQFDVAFADPPYAGEQAALLVAIFRLTPFARVFAIEHPADQPMPGDDTRRYGDTGVTFIYAP